MDQPTSTLITAGPQNGARSGAQAHGWELLFPDRHPHAGGAEHYAAYLTDTDRYEVELVASDFSA